MEWMILPVVGIDITQPDRRQSASVGSQELSVLLDSPDKCLIIEPEDWHTMHGFSEDAILMVLASEYFDAADYIHTPYQIQCAI